jgi:spore maturation protein CgeB
MKILHAGRMSPGSSSLNRVWALERLGHTIVSIDPHDYYLKNDLLRKIAFRVSAGPHVQRFNHDLLQVAKAERPDVLWADKVLILQPSTLKALGAMGILTVSYMIDNAFGPRKDPGWRLYIKDIPLFDLHVTQRDVSIGHYRQRGARDVMKIQTAYEPTIHFPSPMPIRDTDRDRDVSFIGSPYDDRADIMTNVGEAGIPLTISGNPRAWARALTPTAYDKMFRIGELWEKEYRETIWKSKINLSFLTKSNQDEYTHKSFEIAGCGGFLLAERCAGHSLKFKEDEEAVFFDTTEDLIAKIRHYLPDEAARNRIAAAGLERANRDGYSNDHQMALIIARLVQIATARNQRDRG